MKLPRQPPDIKALADEIKIKGEMQNALLSYLRREDVQTFVRDINDRYLSWDEFVHRPIPPNADQNSLWYFIKINRHQQSRKINISTNQNLRFQYAINASGELQQKLHILDMSFGASLGMHTVPIPKGDEQKYLLSSLREEAIASSQLEGATTAHDAAEEMLKRGRRPQNNSERMIFNNYRTMEKLVDAVGSNKTLTPEMILDIHSSITRDTLKKKEWETQFRDNNEVKVYDRETNEPVHTPPISHEEVPTVIQQLCDFANTDNHSPYIHPTVKASILHFLIGYIHPFEDGNGRTARSLFYWYLLSKEYRLMRYISFSRVILTSPAQYARAFLYTEQDENDLTFFIKFNIEKLSQALEDLRTYVKKKTAEKELYFNEYLKLEGINERQASILSDFAKKPGQLITIAMVVDAYQVVYQTARTDLLSLESQGFLIKKQTGKKLLFYRSARFEELLKLKK